MAKIALFAPRSQTAEDILGRFRSKVGDHDCGEAVLFSNGGTQLTTDGDDVPHMYTGLDAGFRRALIVDQFPVFFDVEFTFAWLIKLLEDMGEGSELLIEIENDTRNSARNRVTAEAVKSLFSSCCEVRTEGGVVAVTYSEGVIDLGRRVRSIYPAFHRGFDDFAVAFKRSHVGKGWDDSFACSEALRMYVYSLYGAHHKSFISKRIVSEMLQTGSERPAMLDMGGGFGFLGAEMAKFGFEVEVSDYSGEHVEIGEWVMERCGLGDVVRPVVGTIEEVVDRGEVEKYDVVSMFGALLYAKRDMVPEIMRACMRSLKPGGLFLLHENPAGVIRPGSKDYDICFREEELLGLLKAHAGDPVFYNVFTGMSVGWEDTLGRVKMSAVPKM